MACLSCSRQARCTHLDRFFRTRQNPFGFLGMSGSIEIDRKIDANDPGCVKTSSQL